jgi:hypothetical protein
MGEFDKKEPGEVAVQALSTELDWAKFLNVRKEAPKSSFVSEAKQSQLWEGWDVDMPPQKVSSYTSQTEIRGFEKQLQQTSLVASQSRSEGKPMKRKAPLSKICSLRKSISDRGRHILLQTVVLRHYLHSFWIPKKSAWGQGRPSSTNCAVKVVVTVSHDELTISLL